MVFTLNKFQIFNQKGAFNDDFRAVQLSGRSVTTYTEAKKGRGKEGAEREKERVDREREGGIEKERGGREREGGGKREAAEREREIERGKRAGADPGFKKGGFNVVPKTDTGGDTHNYL